MSGKDKEIYYSLVFHQDNTPILLSALTLRSRQMGQVDICYMSDKCVLYIIEVKSSLGVLALTRKQRMRLNYSLQLISEVYQCEGQIRVVS